MKSEKKLGYVKFNFDDDGVYRARIFLEDTGKWQECLKEATCKSDIVHFANNILAAEEKPI